MTGCSTWTAARRGAAALIVLALGACAQDKPKPIENNILPADYRSQVVGQVHRQIDLGNIRDAYIAEPELKTFLPTPRYVACVRFNGMDGNGVLKGNKVYAAYFYSGRITQVVEATVEQCDKAAFLPFPELK